MLTATVLLLSALVGAAISLYMTLKYYRLSGAITPGEDTERSVVQTGYARIFGLPNSMLGLVFYLFITAVSVFRIVTGNWILLIPAFAASVAAVAFSVYLAWSLLFALKQSCPLCFTSHVLNLLIAAMLLAVIYG